MKALLLMMLAIVSSTGRVSAITLDIDSQDYSVSLPSTTTMNAGEDYSPLLESSTKVTLSIGGVPSSAPVTNTTECGETTPAWKVTAYLVSTPQANIGVSVKRDSFGGGLFGSANYIDLSGTTAASPATLFCGNGSLVTVDLLYKFSGISTVVGYGQHDWSIRYEVTTL